MLIPTELVLNIRTFPAKNVNLTTYERRQRPNGMTESINLRYTKDRYETVLRKRGCVSCMHPITLKHSDHLALKNVGLNLSIVPLFNSPDSRAIQNSYGPFFLAFERTCTLKK